MKQGDVLVITEAIDGSDPSVRIAELPELDEYRDMDISFSVNGQTVSPDYIVSMMDEITILPADTDQADVQ